MGNKRSKLGGGGVGSKQTKSGRVKIRARANIECDGVSERLLASKPHDSEKRAPIFHT